ncbi:MAG: TetR/AcrR family transcriptional regulator [bacterium]|nr:TetR/AcrR family transcriptional regulator [bacterium]
MELSQRILDATIEEFNEKGMKFTMDDIAKRLGISKKTLYTVFRDKETLFLEMVDYCFDEIKRYKDQLFMLKTVDAVTKLKQVMIAMPEKLQGLDWRQIYLLKEKHPNIYKKIEQKLESGWEPIEALFDQAVMEGKVKKVHFAVVKAIVESSIEHFIGNSMLIEQNINYQDSLSEMIEIVIDGISNKEN